MDRVIDPRTPSLDVSRLPTVVFGSRSLMWWGTSAFMVIEGWTVGLTVMSYFYFRQNTLAWPPHRTAEPDLLLPTINLGLMFASLVPAWFAAKAGERLDRRRTTFWLFVTGAAGLVTLVLRWFELWGTNTRWDTTAYGSIVWLIVGLHGTLMMMDIGDTIGLAVMFARQELPPHYYSDTEDGSMYWLFTVLLWVPLYLIVYVAPRFI